ncbi:hypothetical protein [Desulfosporosinus youngiae]|uniref:Uncharacterized protein n=1 Tax=Desulfosporosinus youngiae DSM 17734 TaxID=768710 RepID=H5Y268_9FIRM|nr:hypothetical protein [Desulfosporosinus youngiae]EHQ88266.1 hypothetical protein DesyoDRAFT_1096 [Desulfosporosinus youngiae DSM 17734]
MESKKFDFGSYGTITCAIEYKNGLYHASTTSQIDFREIDSWGKSEEDAALHLLTKVQREDGKAL